MMKPLVGILLDPQVYRGIRRGRTGTERIKLYRQAAKSLEINLIFTCLPLINLKSLSVRGIFVQGERLKPVTAALPHVFHNRSMPFQHAEKKKLKSLSKHAAVFNRNTRYSKLYIHKLLLKNKQLREHLPETYSLSRKNLKKMMNKHAALFVKPASGSIGEGIYKLSKDNGNGRWLLQASRRKRTINPDSAYAKLNLKSGKKPYLVQEGIPLAQYHGSPFDFRVSVQKDGSGRWQVTGIVGKVAARGKHVTNIGRGGHAKQAAKLFSSVGLSPNTAASSVKKVSLIAAEYLGSRLPRLADIGFDIGIDAAGKPYMIEMNGRDQRYSFREAGMMHEWYKTYENPLAYAKYLLRGKRLKRMLQ